MDEPRELLGLADVASRAGMEYMTLWRRWRAGKLPTPAAIVGKIPGWEPAVVDAWIAEQAQS